jgi:hypothetical protein
MRLLKGEHEKLLPEWLSLAAQRNFVALPQTLPLLLSTGTAKDDLREVILAILGERGRWLASQNPDWSWVGGGSAGDEGIWETGEPAARQLFLKRLRLAEPDRARELLQSTWKEESAEERALFIAVLKTGLTPADEPFLEAALDDKRKEIRQSAAQSLAMIPGSMLAQRMLARVRPLLKFTPGESGSLLKLKKSKPATLEITLPTECDKPMVRDGIEPKAIFGLGEKIWWLVQMLETVPLDFWTQEWNTKPNDIIIASATGEWEKELFEAWTRAAIRQKNDAWAAELLALAIRTKHFNKLEGLTGAMSAEQCERIFAPLLDADDGKTGEIQAPLMSAHRQPWSPAFSRTVLLWMRKITANPSNNWPLRSQLKDFAFYLAPEVLNEAVNGWPTEMSTWEFWSKGMDEFLSLVQFRADIHSALNPTTTS